MGRIPQTTRRGLSLWFLARREPRARRRPGRTAVLLAVAVPLLGAAAGTRAGVVPLSRQSWIQAAGNAPGAGPDNFNLTGGTRTFDPFSNNLNDNADSTAAALADAHQYSVPAASPGGLEGAYAEGTVRAELNAPRSSALARSGFDLTFKVTDAPAWYDFGGAFGTEGGGTSRARLMSIVAPGKMRSIFSTEAEGSPAGPDGSRALSRQGILSPGVYAFEVSADAPGTLDSSSAYFTINLALNGNVSRGGAGTGLGGSAGPGGGPAAAPMPAAVWPGLLMLAGLAVLIRTPRRNAVRWAWK